MALFLTLALGACSGSSSDGGGARVAGKAVASLSVAASAAPASNLADTASRDPNCTSKDAKSGMSCTVDCTIPCGYGWLGTKTCTCSGGVYISCPCLRPDAFRGAFAAPYCATADGTTGALKSAPCSNEWQECVGKDPVSSSTPQGCVCMTDPAANALRWKCGSTNKWFKLSM